VTGSKEITRLEKSAVRLTIKIPNEELRTEYDSFIKEVLRDAQIPGFRRGKVTKDILERKMGSALNEQILNTIVSNSVKEYVESKDTPDENKPLFYQDPVVDGDPKLDLNTDLEFSVIYDVYPKINIEKWSDFDIELNTTEITKDDVQRELDKIRERNAVVMDSDEPVHKGNVVTIDYCELNEDGTVTPGSEREDFVFTVGSEQNYYKIDDELIGFKIGESHDIKKTYPAKFENPEMAGTTKTIRVKVKAIKEKKLPDLDDEFAQDVDEKYKTMSDLKNGITELLNVNLEEGTKYLQYKAVLDKIVEKTPIEPPESMVKYELLNKLEELMSGYGASREDIALSLEKGGNKMAEVLRPAIEKRIITSFITNELVKILGIDVSDADREQEYKTFADKNNKTVDEIKKMIGSNTASIDGIIAERKLVDSLLAKNNFKKGKKVKYLELFPENA
jgi:trigger factor